MKQETPICKAVRLIGGTQQEVAQKLAKYKPTTIQGRALKLSQKRISAWIKRGYPPAEVCLAIERETNGEVTRHELRPDVFSSEAVA